MKSFPSDLQLNITLKAHLRHNLSQTIQTAQLLSLNAEELYEYLLQAAEANPMLLIQRTSPSEPSLFACREGFDPGVLSAPLEQELPAYLHRQLAFLPLCEKQRKLVSYLIDTLDENGFLPDAPAQLAKELSVSSAQLQSALAVLQSFDPPGIGARDLRQCLLLQLLRLPHRNFLAEQILQAHWELFLRTQKTGKFAAVLWASAEDVQQALALIASLNPHPANGFSGRQTQYVTPDAYLFREENILRVQLHNNCTLSIDTSYLDFFADIQDAAVQTFLKSCEQQAKQLASRIDYRNTILEKILLLVVRHQSDFFAGGEKQPLLQKDVAQMLGIHVSTLSRAISGKYLSFDGRCIALRELFSRRSASDRTRSTHSVQQQILSLIAKEDPYHPLSDEKLRAALLQDGIDVSRRLITKYRLLAGAPPAYARKIYRENTGRKNLSARGEKE